MKCWRCLLSCPIGHNSVKGNGYVKTFSQFDLLFYRLGAVVDSELQKSQLSSVLISRKVSGTLESFGVIAEFTLTSLLLLKGPGSK